ncbi:hypothetical protein K438DRAFT_1992266 [Mycena galopus ATCC 62051]|nr:hypothetical protein K438DRAFT_1992266 [Mycena galopus ATCC 62051]
MATGTSEPGIAMFSSTGLVTNALRIKKTNLIDVYTPPHWLMLEEASPLRLGLQRRRGGGEEGTTWQARDETATSEGLVIALFFLPPPPSFSLLPLPPSSAIHSFGFSVPYASPTLLLSVNLQLVLRRPRPFCRAQLRRSGGFRLVNCLKITLLHIIPHKMEPTTPPPQDPRDLFADDSPASPQSSLQSSPASDFSVGSRILAYSQDLAHNSAFFESVTILPGDAGYVEESSFENTSSVGNDSFLGASGPFTATEQRFTYSCVSIPGIVTLSPEHEAANDHDQLASASASLEQREQCPHAAPTPASTRDKRALQDPPSAGMRSHPQSLFRPRQCAVDACAAPTIGAARANADAAAPTSVTVTSGSRAPALPRTSSLVPAAPPHTSSLAPAPAASVTVASGSRAPAPPRLAPAALPLAPAPTASVAVAVASGSRAPALPRTSSLAPAALPRTSSLAPAPAASGSCAPAPLRTSSLPPAPTASASHAPAPPRTSSLAPVPSVHDGYIPIERFRGTTDEFDVQAGFHSVALPPPPTMWAESRLRPAEPTRYDEDIAMHLQEQDLEQAEMEADPEADEPEAEELSARSLAGTPTPTPQKQPASGGAARHHTVQQQTILDTTFEAVQSALVECANATGLSFDYILKLYAHIEQLKLRGTSEWNRYQRFGNYNDENKLRERRRLDPNYSSEFPVPPLHPAELAKSFKLFKEHMGESASAALDTFFEISGTADITIHGREHKFATTVKNFQKLTARTQVDDFFAVTILVGGHNCEDEKLGEMITSAGLENVLARNFISKNDDIIGMVKGKATNLILKAQRMLRREAQGLVGDNSDSDKSDADVDAPRKPSRLSRPVPPTAGPSSKTEHVPSLGIACSSARPPSARPPSALNPFGYVRKKPRNEVTRGFMEAGITAATAAADSLRGICAAPFSLGTPDGDTSEGSLQIRDVRCLLTLASEEDLGLDVFAEFRTNGFTYTVLPGILGERNIRIINYPNDNRHPTEVRATKASSSWKRGEHENFKVSIAARSVPGQGIHFEWHDHPDHTMALVIVSHNYSLALPANSTPEATQRFWRSSKVPVRLSAGDYTAWHLPYDLDDPTTLVRPPKTKPELDAEKVEKSKATGKTHGGKRKAAEDDDE